MLKKMVFFAFLFVVGSLSAEIKVLAFAGSTRADSYNKKLVKEAAEIARQMGATVTVIDLKDYPIPLYEGDLEMKQGMPANAKKLRQLMIASNAMIIATPEHNSSVPAVLKNALDWASRSEEGKPSKEVFAGKKIAIMSASPGRGGGARALVHLKSILEDVKANIISKQVSVSQANTAFNAQGKLQNPATKQELSEEISLLIK